MGTPGVLGLGLTAAFPTAAVLPSHAVLGVGVGLWKPRAGPARGMGGCLAMPSVSLGRKIFIYTHLQGLLVRPPKVDRNAVPLFIPSAG